MKVTSKPITACQSCDARPLTSILFLGYMPPVNAMPPIGEPLVEQPAYPLELFRCDACGLVQIGTDVDQTVLFAPSYPYRSNSTKILRENFAELYRESSELLGLKPEDFVVDIGSNDGTLLANFLVGGQRVLGVEPSEAGAEARTRGVDTLTAFFGLETARRIRAEHGPAKLITATNVFAHITDVHGVLGGIVEMCAEEGIFVNESHYLPTLLETLQYDTIYHEHLRYYGLHSMKPMLEKHGLEIFHVRKIPTHGGSIRVYAARAGRRRIEPSVAALLEEERQRGIASGSAFATFRREVLQSKLDLHALLADIKRQDGRIYGIGAPSRASTLINYTGLDDGILDCVLEVSTSRKIGKYIPGTVIPVLDEKKLFEDQPEYALLLSWHIAEELMSNLRRKGFRGRFVIPLPQPRIIG